MEAAGVTAVALGPFFGGFGVRDDEWQFTVLHHCR